MRVLVLGGGRFQGRRCAEMLIEAGHDVVVFNRGGTAPEGARPVKGERGDADALAAAFSGGPFDCVVDNIAYCAEDVRGVLPLVARHAGHYILISSFLIYEKDETASHGTAHLKLVTEEEGGLPSLNEPEPGSTLCGPPGSTGSGTGRRQGESEKRGCEIALMRASLPVPWTILRFCQLQGPGDPSNRRGFFEDRVADGGGVLIPSDFTQPFQPLWRDDAARAVAAAVENPPTAGSPAAASAVENQSASRNRVYNVAGDEILTLKEWLDLLAEALGVEPPYILQLPFADLRRLAGFPYRLPHPMRPLLDTTAARRDLGFAPTPARQWLPDTVAWWRKSGLTSRFWEHREQERAAIAKVRGMIPPTTGEPF